MAILTNSVYGAVAEGTGVKLVLGNIDVKMSYVDALKMSQFLRIAGKQAKAAAGDASRHWSIAATLSAAESSEGMSHGGKSP